MMPFATLFAPAMLIFHIGKNTVCVIIAAAAVRRARETAARVAAGAIARQVLASFGVSIRGRLAQMGDLQAPLGAWENTDNNPFFSANTEVTAAMEQKIAQLRRDGDSCGAVIEVIALGMPAGWGEPVFDRLDADIA